MVRFLIYCCLAGAGGETRNYFSPLFSSLLEGAADTLGELVVGGCGKIYFPNCGAISALSLDLPFNDANNAIGAGVTLGKVVVDKAYFPIYDGAGDTVGGNAILYARKLSSSSIAANI